MNSLLVFTLPFLDISAVLVSISVIIGSFGTILGAVGGILATLLQRWHKEEQKVSKITVTIDDGTTRRVIKANSANEAEIILHNISVDK